MTDPNPNFMPNATASLSWVDGQGVTHWRVYSTDGYDVIEWAMDGDSGWNQTDFTTPGQQVSANVHTYNGAAYLRLYCTFADQTVEWCQDDGGSWTKGTYVWPPAQ